MSEEPSGKLECGYQLSKRMNYEDQSSHGKKDKGTLMSTSAINEGQRRR